MLFVFSFALASLALGFLLSLEEINPFRPTPLPMLEQIELCMAHDKTGDKDADQFPLAA
jgi:hypothetical protein